MERLRAARRCLALGRCSPAGDTPAANRNLEVSTATIFILTGATGLLGGRLVANLLRNADRSIKCLVRGGEAEAHARLGAYLEALGISPTSIRQRLTCISVDLSKPTLGLSDKPYAALADNAATLINCAAMLDFIRPYAALRPINVEGTRAMISLVAAGRRKRLLHVSSISVLESSLRAFQRIGEGEALDYPESLLTGYAQSKWVSDVMVSHARQRGLLVSVFRIPWLLDVPPKGRRPVEGFLLRLLATCAEIGCLPETAARFNIVSVEFAARIIAAIALVPDCGEPIFHLGAERGLDVAEVQSALRAANPAITLVPIEEWAERLERKLREVAHHPLGPFAPLFIKRNGKEIKIAPYLAGRMPEMDSTATGLILSRLGLETIPSARSARRLLAAVWALRQSHVLARAV